MFRVVSSSFVGPKTVTRCFGRRFGSLGKGRPSRSPFDRDQNEDGFMIVGRGAEPSTLRPNLANSSSTTSDENWARILDDVDPPSPYLMHSARALRPGASSSLPLRKQTATEMELRAMDSIFEKVFGMDVPTNTHGYTLNGSGRGGFLSHPSTLAGKRSGAYTESDSEIQFDKKREGMYACSSDQELLQWAMREVFTQPPGETTTSPTSPPDTPKDASATPGGIHPDIYGRMVAGLMKEFREQYNNPHLAIAIFDYTRRLSIISYVTGCTTPSYNELMRTHWCSFRNLQAVVNVAEEMRVNGVLPDQATAPLLIQISDEAKQRVVWTEESEAEVARLLDQLGTLLTPPEYKPIAPKQQQNRKPNRRNVGGRRFQLDDLLGEVGDLDSERPSPAAL
ncbi:hypothetical protein FS749_003044 [Ceratobasidium sp. UAMH 11750]|nr:hypothetical protein FS749_003044 [Ceratobasidium sp. UAMH 11750]